MSTICQNLLVPNKRYSPDVIEIDNQNVTYYKGRVIGYYKTVIPHSSVASVSIDSNLFFANLIIETFGGSSIKVNGFTKSDAKEIVRLLTHKRIAKLPEIISALFKRIENQRL